MLEYFDPDTLLYDGSPSSIHRSLRIELLPKKFCSFFLQRHYELYCNRQKLVLRWKVRPIGLNWIHKGEQLRVVVLFADSTAQVLDFDEQGLLWQSKIDPVPPSRWYVFYYDIKASTVNVS